MKRWLLVTLVIGCEQAATPNTAAAPEPSAPSASAAMEVLLPAARPAEDASATSTVSEPRKVRFEFDTASAADVLDALAEVRGQPLLVDPEAAALVACSTFTIRAGSEITADRALALVARNAKRDGLLVSEADGKLVVKKAEGAVCPAKKGP